MQSDIGVLFQNQNSSPVDFVDIFDLPEDILNDDKCQSKQRLIKENPIGFVDQSAPYRQHLLFASRQSSPPYVLFAHTVSGNS